MSRENDSKQRGKFSRLKQVACTKMFKRFILNEGREMEIHLSLEAHRKFAKIRCTEEVEKNHLQSSF